MATRLRPLTTLEVLDAAWLILRRNWAAMYASSGVGTAPLVLALMAYFYWLGTLVAGTEDSVFYGGTLAWATGMSAGVVLNSLARGAVTAIALAETRGESLPMLAAWKQAGRRSLGIVYVGLVGFAAAWLASGCFVVPGLLLMMGWWVARPVAMTEEMPFAAALRRSWRLTAGYRDKAFGLWLLSTGLWAFTAVNLHLLLHFLLGSVAGVLGIDTGNITPHLQPKNQIYLTLLASLAFVLVDPLKSCIDALLYVDLRIRREGADLEERLRELRSTAVLGALLLAALLAPARAQAATLEQYAQRVRALRQEVARASSADDVDPIRISELRSQFVQLPAGQKLTVRNEWIRDGVDGWKTPEDKAALLSRLDALERSLGTLDGGSPQSANSHSKPPPSPAPSIDTKQALQQILAEPEFQPLAERSELKDLIKSVDLSKTKTWWQSFTDWIKKHLFPQSPPPKTEPPRWNWKGGETVVYVLLGIVILVLLAMLVKWIIERPLRDEAVTGATVAEAPPLEASATENALDHSVDEWELFAQQWLGRGDVRQAIRSLYLATLVHLHRERRIDYNRAFTNWIYVRQFRGEESQKQILRQLTRLFDEVWYGERPCGEDQYRSFERGVRDLGTPAPVGK